MSAVANINYGVSGRYKIHAHTADGKQRLLADWFDNLITNNGLDLLADKSWTQGFMSRCVVSADTAAPSVGQSSVSDIVASTSTANFNQGAIDEVNRYVTQTRSWQFSQGAAAGNISTIAVGLADDNLGSIALVRNSNGDPVTINVQNNEFLTVTYQLKVKQPISDITYDDIDGHAVVMRPSLINSVGGWSQQRMTLEAANSGSTISFGSTGTINAIDSAPSLPSSAFRASSAENDAYVTGSFTRTGKIIFGIDRANALLNSFRVRLGIGTFQLSVDPPINKTNEDELSLGFTIRWAREGELPA